VSMGREIASFGLSVSTDTDSTDPLAHAKNLGVFNCLCIRLLFERIDA